MAYSDYGGYAYRNGERIEDRSDATIGPEGDVFGSPGMWPGFVAYAIGGQEEYERRQSWPSGHAILGDGPIYVVLYKKSTIQIYRGMEKLNELDLLKGMPEEAIETFESGGKTFRWINQ